MMNWILIRAAGIGAYGMLWLAVAWGLAATTAAVSHRVSKQTSTLFHQFAASAGLALLFIHMFLLVVDKFMPYSFLDVVVPMRHTFRPVPVTFGVVAMYGVVIVMVTSWLRKPIGTLWWRRIHLLAVPAYTLALAHGIFTGTDTNRTWMVAMYGITGTTVLFLIFVRALTYGYRAPRAEPPARAAAAARPRPAAGGADAAEAPAAAAPIAGAGAAAVTPAASNAKPARTTPPGWGSSRALDATPAPESPAAVAPEPAVAQPVAPPEPAPVAPAPVAEVAPPEPVVEYVAPEPPPVAPAQPVAEVVFAPAPVEVPAPEQVVEFVASPDPIPAPPPVPTARPAPARAERKPDPPSIASMETSADNIPMSSFALRTLETSPRKADEATDNGGNGHGSSRATGGETLAEAAHRPDRGRELDDAFGNGKPEAEDDDLPPKPEAGLETAPL